MGSRVSRMRTGVTGTNVDSLAPIADARHAVNDHDESECDGEASGEPHDRTDT